MFVPSCDRRKSWSMRRGTGILSAELHALAKAVLEARDLCQGVDNISIFTDSKTAIQVVADLENEMDIVINIRQEIQSAAAAGTMITLTWIPSHIGIPGNEVVDELASSGRINPTEGVINNRLTVGEKLSSFKKTWREATIDQLTTGSTNQAVTARKKWGPLPWHCIKARSVQTCLFRLRSGHNNLKKCVAKWNDDDDNMCRFGCPEEENNEHVLLQCVEHSAHRWAITRLFQEIRQPLTLLSLLGLNSNIPARVQVRISRALCDFVVKSDIVGMV